MSDKHTPTKLHVEDRHEHGLPVALYLSSESGYMVAQTEWPGEKDYANFDRMAALWNACQGISTDDLEAGKVVVVPADVVDAINDAIWALENVATAPKAVALERLKEAQAALSRIQQKPPSKASDDIMAVVATSGDKTKWPKCAECGAVHWTLDWVDGRALCNECQQKPSGGAEK